MRRLPVVIECHVRRLSGDHPRSTRLEPLSWFAEPSRQAFTRKALFVRNDCTGSQVGSAHQVIRVRTVGMRKGCSVAVESVIACSRSARLLFVRRSDLAFGAVVTSMVMFGSTSCPAR